MVQLSLRGIDYEDIFKQYDAVYDVVVVDDEVMPIIARVVNMESGFAFNLKGTVVITNTVLRKASEGDKESLFAIKHEHRHNDYRGLHGENMSGSEQRLVDELYAYFSAFIDVYGLTSLTETRNTQIGSGTWAQIVAGALTKDYINGFYKEELDEKAREVLRVKLIIAAFVIDAVVKKYGNIGLEYLKQAVSLNSILSILERDGVEQLIKYYSSESTPEIIIKDYESLHRSFLAFKEKNQSQFVSLPATETTSAGSSPVSGMTRRDFLKNAAIATGTAAMALNSTAVEALELAAARPKQKPQPKTSKQPAVKSMSPDNQQDKLNTYVIKEIPNDDAYVLSLVNKLRDNLGIYLTPSLLKGYIGLSNVRVNLINGIYDLLSKNGVSFKQGYNMLFVSEPQIEGQALVLGGENLVILDLNQFIDQIKKDLKDWDPKKREILEVLTAGGSASLDSKGISLLEQEKVANETKLNVMRALKMPAVYQAPAWYQTIVTAAYRGINNNKDLFRKRGVTQDEFNQAKLSNIAINNNDVIKATLRIKYLDVLVFIFPDGTIEIPQNKEAAETANPIVSSFITRNSESKFLKGSPFGAKFFKGDPWGLKF